MSLRTAEAAGGEDVVVGVSGNKILDVDMAAGTGTDTGTGTPADVDEELLLSSPSSFLGEVPATAAGGSSESAFRGGSEVIHIGASE